MSNQKPCPYPDGDDGLLEYGLWQLEKDRLSSQNISPEMLAKLDKQQTTRTRVKNEDLFVSPNAVGASEYRAIYECIADALSDYDEGEHAAVAKSMLNEFIDHAKAMKKRLKKMVKIDRLKAIKKDESDQP